jgi:hypothetical protein
MSSGILLPDTLGKRSHSVSGVDISEDILGTPTLSVGMSLTALAITPFGLGFCGTLLDELSIYSFCSIIEIDIREIWKRYTKESRIVNRLLVKAYVIVYCFFCSQKNFYIDLRVVHITYSISGRSKELI